MAALEYKGPIEGYIVNFSRTNFWRVERSMTRDDLMQEAFVVYLRVQDQYPDVVDAPHFMALFKTAWFRHFVDLANVDTSMRVEVQASVMPDNDEMPEQWANHVGELNNDGYMATLVRQAPSEVTMVLNLFLSAPTELLELALSGWNGKSKRERTGGSKRICQLLGLPKDLDVLKMVTDHFSEH